ncbi:serine/threonine-protein kinase M1, partial [Thoreauomyces humboldtii]
AVLVSWPVLSSPCVIRCLDSLVDIALRVLDPEVKHLVAFVARASASATNLEIRAAVLTTLPYLSVAFNGDAAAITTILGALSPRAFHRSDEHLYIASAFGYFACARAGSLTIDHDVLKSDRVALCHLCDPSASEPDAKDRRPSLLLDDWTVFLHLASNVSKPVVISFFRSCVRVFNHQPRVQGKRNVDALSTFIDSCIVGVRSRGRAVREAASEALVAIVAAAQKSLYGTQLNQFIVSTRAKLVDLSKDGKTWVAAAFLTLMGDLGSIANEMLLFHVLRLLIDYFASETVILRSIAHEQIQWIARARKNTVQRLLDPYRQDISIYWIDLAESNPPVCAKFLHVIGMSKTDFLEQNLQYLLPHLVLNQRYEILEDLARTRHQKMTRMLLDESGSILAAILMKDGDYNVALDAFLGVFPEAFSSYSLVKTCSIVMINKLVFRLAEPDARPKAVEALEVTKNLLSTGLEWSMSEFLHSHLLAILQDVNEQIRDADGTRTEECKCKSLLSLAEVIRLVGRPVESVTPQIVTTLRTGLTLASLRAASLACWRQLLLTSDLAVVGLILNQVCIALTKHLSAYTPEEHETMVSILEDLFVTKRARLTSYFGGVCALPEIPQFIRINDLLRDHRRALTTLQQISRLLIPVADENADVSRIALRELRSLLSDPSNVVDEYVLQDSVDPCINKAILVLMETCRRYNGVDLDIEALCCDCLGALGAIDPARVDVSLHNRLDTGGTLGSDGDFSTDQQAVAFASALIENRLAPALRSAHDTKLQSNHAFAVQELLLFSGYTRQLVQEAESEGNVVDLTVESPKALLKQWLQFSPSVRNTIRPLIGAKYIVNTSRTAQCQHIYPLFARDESFQGWMRAWSVDLILKSKGARAQKIFLLCKNLITMGDINVAQFILPHLVLNVLIAGTDTQRNEICTEFLAILREPTKKAPEVEKRKLCCQTVFSLVDHLTKWLRLRRVTAAKKRASLARRQSKFVDVEDTGLQADVSAQKIETFLARIPQHAMAEASFYCEAYARALLHFEQHIRQERLTKDEETLQPLYAHLQRIYSHLDEPDGMEGIASLVLTPTLDQQILEHESAGRWTDAQTCYELFLQETPERLEHHIGLISCLKNIGHLETLLSHVQGVVTLQPKWATTLNSYAIEAAWRLGNWSTLERLLKEPYNERFETAIGALLNTVRIGDDQEFENTLQRTRMMLTADLATASMESYRRGYDTLVKLHMLFEITSARNASASTALVDESLYKRWGPRLDATMPSFRVREPILSLQRIILQNPRPASLDDSLDMDRPALRARRGMLWLQTAKASRKAGQLQAAYNGILQATRLGIADVHLERAKWLWSQQQKHKAMFELKSALQTISREVTRQDTNSKINKTSLTHPSATASARSSKGRTLLLLTRYIEETDAGHAAMIIESYSEVIKELPDWEKASYYLGRYYNKLYESEGKKQRSTTAHGTTPAQLANMSYVICKHYGKALTFGTKYIYQTLPRLLTLWLDLGQLPSTYHDAEVGANADPRVGRFHQVTRIVRKLVEKVPAYQFLTAIPQIVSRIGHPNPNVHQILEAILVNVLCVYPQQTLWQLVAVARASSKLRSQRVANVFAKAKANPMIRQLSQGSVASLIQEGQALSGHLLDLCNFPLPRGESTLSVKKHFRVMERLAQGGLQIIVPLQTTMTVGLPSGKQASSDHRPFPSDAPTILGFHDEIEVMSSLQRPRKLTIKGSDGRDYIFLCKPKDDLRKDCRLMEFNSMINKLLKKDPETRRRRLYIRTYAVVPLNEECGLIEWVPNTIGFRHIMVAAYKTKNIYCQPLDVKAMIDRKTPSPEEIFTKLVKPKFPPIFHEWFMETFPEPSQWLASRLAYSTTIAVMSMVGYVVGLGDRHGENILFDDQTGDCVHVDLNCLFEKGLTFEKPEKVPFRLTHNMVDAFGVTGVEGLEVFFALVRTSRPAELLIFPIPTGVFRQSCEATMKVLRGNRESLMSVLETFMYDPLCEWNKPSSRSRTAASRREENGEVENEQARQTLDVINRKLQGYASGAAPSALPLGPEGQVHELIQQATSISNLAAMYIGWTAYM